MALPARVMNYNKLTVTDVASTMILSSAPLICKSARTTLMVKVSSQHLINAFFVCMIFPIGYCPIDTTFVRVSLDTGYRLYDIGNRASWQSPQMCDRLTGAYVAMYKTQEDIAGARQYLSSIGKEKKSCHDTSSNQSISPRQAEFEPHGWACGHCCRNLH